MIKLNNKEITFDLLYNNESYAKTKLKTCSSGTNSHSIFFKFEEEKEIFLLQYVKSFIDDFYGGSSCELIMPYVPYSRNDDTFSQDFDMLKAFCNIVNKLNFNEVLIFEPHSDVVCSLLNKVSVRHSSRNLLYTAMRDHLGLTGDCWFEPALSYTDGSRFEDHNLEGLFYKSQKENIYIVYPTMESYIRYKNKIKYPNFLIYDQNKDEYTKKIEHKNINRIPDNEDCKTAIIINDIFSSDEEYLGLAIDLCNTYTELEKIILCVTHCENTIYESTILHSDYIDKIYTTNSILKEKSLSEDITYDPSKLIIEDCRE